VGEPRDSAGGGLEAPRDGRPWLAGTLTALSILEVVQLVFTSLKSGVLRLSSAGPIGAAAPGRPRERSFYFREGQLVFAASTEPCDRLGPVLWRAGLIDREALERCGAGVRPDRPLGQVLVGEGILTAGDLYAGVAEQVREILFEAFLDAEGEFLFVEGPHLERNEVRLPERTRELLLEGMKRVDELERLLAAVGGRGARLARAGALPIDASEFAARLVEALEGGRGLVEAAEESRLGLLVALREAVPLLEAGVLVGAGPEPSALTPPPAPPPADDGARSPSGPLPGPRPGGPFELYRRIFRRVHAALAAARPGAERRLDSYFAGVPENRRFVFEGVRFGPEGDLDVARVLANVSATDAYRGASARARSLEGLEELLTFALFEVKNVLPRPDAERLLREVGRMQVGKA
jgi:hypothetical protein